MEIGRRALAAVLIVLMAIGSIVLWLGIPASMVVVGKGLSRLNRTYGSLMGTAPTTRMRSSWMKSMRGERDSERPRSVLDVVMVWSVALALLCFGVWFFAFAGSSLPT